MINPPVYVESGQHAFTAISRGRGGLAILAQLGAHLGAHLGD
jgi:hypothetical protein